MSKKLQLSIPKPCHENWDAMTPVEKGKFCGSCQKQVVDFSTMSDRQVAQFFKKPILSLSKDGSVCGRFMSDQLDRDIEIPKKRIPWLKYFFTIALPAFFLSLKSSASKTQGQVKIRKAATADTTGKKIYDDVKMMGMVSRPQSIKPFMGDTVVVPAQKPVVEDTTPVCTKPMMGKPSFEILSGEVAVVEKNSRIPVKGIVVDEKGEPVPFATIKTGKEKIIVAGADGRFEVKKNLVGKNRELTISSAGYEARTILPDEENYLTGELYVVLKANITLPEVILNSGHVLGRLTRCYTTSQVMGGVITGVKVSKIIEREVVTPDVDNSVKIYPNPISSGSGLTIEWKQTEEGYYNFQLINVSGQVVCQKEIWIDAEARLLNIEMPVVPAGSYFLVLANKKTGRKFTERLIVQ